MTHSHFYYNFNNVKTYTITRKCTFLFRLKQQQKDVDPLSYILFQPLLHHRCKSYGMCYPVWDGAYKKSLAANKKKIAHIVTAAGFLSRYLNGPLPYV